MRVEKFVADKSGKLSELLLTKYSFLSYNLVQKIFRNKDVKVNGKRIGSDLKICENDEIMFYVSETLANNAVDIVFQDENIVVANKPRGIETVSENAGTESLMSKLLTAHEKIFAVHRLDRNTSGLVVFAKNEKSKNSLDTAFKNRTIEKFYLALVYGKLNDKQKTLTAYLKKDDKKSLVYISNEKQAGYVQIKTKYRVVEEFEDSSLVEIELLTGKTHQIRAHFAHIGHFVVGDEKYGDSNINKKFRKKYQCLTAYKIVFNFGESDFLNYLNKKEIELPKEKIDFLSKNK
jgi:23S rRNA pseudouridine955/2504/2580 synthase